MKTRNSADADKPAGRVQRSVNVTKHGNIRYVWYGFPLVCYKNFVPDTPFLRHSTSNYTVTLKPGLGSLKVIVTDMHRCATYDYGPISYRFRDKL